jgi:hypothetical protein
MKQGKRIIKDIKGTLEPMITSSGGGYEEIKASAVTKTRRNAAGTMERTDKFANIDSGLIPYTLTKSNSRSYIGMRDVIILCQKAYYNNGTIRNIIDLMTEFSVSPIHFRGGNKQSLEFCTAYFKKTNLLGFQDRFFREYYRGGSVFILRQDGTISEKDLKKMTQIFGSSNTEIPLKYIILNPADIVLGGAATFVNGSYFKILSDYELEQLRNPRSEEDKALLQSLPKETRDAIKSGSSSVMMPLDNSKITAVFYKKQDYEPLAVPMIYPVLEDVNWKLEMKKQDMAIMRTMQQVILKITMGSEETPPNADHMKAMRELFENQSVGRVLVADYTTKAEFVIPQIAELLNPVKYEQVNQDIRDGLNDIMFGSEKFANQSIKVQIFIERLKQARQAFLNEFLIPEIKRICANLGFKNFPTPVFEDVEFKDGNEFNRTITRLMELGILTPQEGFTAIETGHFPTEEKSIEAQEKFRQLKDKGYYQPLVGGPVDQLETQKEMAKLNADLAPEPAQGVPPAKTAKPAVSGKAGRPSGSKRKQSTKKMTPIGGSEELYSLSSFVDNLTKSDGLQTQVMSALKEKYKKESLTKEQEDIGRQISHIIVANEDPENWTAENVSKYIENPIDTNPDRVKEINSLAADHQITSFTASLLYISEK